MYRIKPYILKIVLEKMSTIKNNVHKFHDMQIFISKHKYEINTMVKRTIQLHKNM